MLSFEGCIARAACDNKQWRGNHNYNGLGNINTCLSSFAVGQDPSNLLFASTRDLFRVFVRFRLLSIYIVLEPSKQQMSWRTAKDHLQISVVLITLLMEWGKHLEKGKGQQGMSDKLG